MAEHSKVLSIPTSEKDIADFILKLLGKGREIGKSLECSFFIDLNGLTNLHHSIDQRVVRQNSASLSSFEARFEFEDGHHYTVVSIEEFLETNFIQNKRCTQAKLSWIYLVTFSNRAPERQQINIVFDVGDAKVEDKKQSPSIDWKIEHTEVTWGYDLSRHVEHSVNAYISTHADPFRHVRNFLKRYNRTLTALGMPAAVMLGLGLTFPNKVEIQKQASALMTEAGPSLDAIDDKLNFLISRHLQNLSLFDLLTPMVIITVSFVASYSLLLKLTEENRFSAIILNDVMARAQERLLANQRHRRGLAAVGFFIAVLSGIFGNAIYDLLKRMLT